MGTSPDLSREDMPTLLRRLQSGDADALTEIMDRLQPGLRGWTKRRLEQEPLLASTYDVDDALQSGCLRMLKSILRGKIPPITAEAEFFRLFRTIMDRRIRDLARRAKLLGRPPRDPPGIGPKLGTCPDDIPDSVDLLESELPGPVVEAIAREECFHLLDLLGPELRTIAERRLDGDTVMEIAAKLGQSTRTIERKLMGIRDIWKGARFDS